MANINLGAIAVVCLAGFVVAVLVAAVVCRRLQGRVLHTALAGGAGAAGVSSLTHLLVIGPTAQSGRRLRPDGDWGRRSFPSGAEGLSAP